MPALSLSNFLKNKLSFAADAAKAVEEQGIKDYDDFIEMVDKDITSLCDKARNPGGMIKRGGRGANADDMIPDRGIKIGYLQEKNLRQARFYIFHRHRIQRPFDTNNAGRTSMGDMRSFWNQRFELEKEGTKADSVSDDIKPLKKEDDVRKALEDLDNTLMNNLGTGGSPLAYVTREHVHLPEEDDTEEDPGIGLPSLQEELVRRTRHDGSHWDADNQAVWKIIRALAHGGPAWNWVSSHAKKRDGRSAYLDLKKHYLGSSFVAKTISDATSELKTIFYNGRSKNFTFESFCGKLNKAFADLLENGQEYTEMMKVHTLLEAIQDPLLEVAKLKVLGDTHLMNNYTETIAYLKVALNSYANHGKTSSHRNISLLNTGGKGGRGGGRGGYRGSGGRGRGRGGRFGKGGRGGGGGRGSPPAEAFDPKDPGKSLSNKAWSKLTPEEKDQAREARRDRKRNISLIDTEEDKEPQDHFRPGDQITRRNKNQKV